MKIPDKDIKKANRRGQREAFIDQAQVLMNKIHANKKKYNRKKIKIEYENND